MMTCSLFLRYLSTWSVFALLASHTGVDAAEPTRPVDFSRDVLPILSDNCFYCHGQDENHRKGDRRLDTQDGAYQEIDGVRAIVPGDINASELVARILTDDPDDVMPPAKEKKKLTSLQKQMLKRWIAEGAKWGTHWAFTAPVKASLPALSGTVANAVVNPIDAFIFSKLEAEKVKRSPEADKRTLLRRLSLDLIGLPPTIPEVDDFLADQSPDAYAKQVDRLLASPHYGERWGRHWLDAARYADSNGYEKDAPRSAWFYRDWVINSFNRDLPYDQFVIEQLAGDELPNPTQDQIVATGFLRNSMINEEGGVDPEQFRMEAMFDRMEAVGKGVLGLTIQCAQCHSHKFDPISHEEYYQLFAFLNNDHEAQPVVYTADQQMKRADVLRQIQDIGMMSREQLVGWEQRLTQWEEERKAEADPQWTVIQPVVEDISTGGQRYLPQPDGSFVAAGFQPVKHEAKLTIHTDVKNITAFRLENISDQGLPGGGPGRSHLGTFGLTEFKVEAAARGAKREPVKFSGAFADIAPAPETPVISNFNEKEPKRRVIGPASYAIDGNEETAWSNDIGPGRRNQDCTAIFTTETPINNEGGTDLMIKLTQKHGGWNADDLHGNNLGRFRISVTSAPDAGKSLLPKNIRTIFAVPREQRSPAQVAVLFNYWRSTLPEAKATNDRIEELWIQYPEGETQMVLAARTDMRETHILQRGDWLKPGNKINAGVPKVLNPLPESASATRLTFAKWLVDPKSPTTARVFVNRIWQHYFGTGIVSTSEDFGVQSDAPSHPELLDWLACDFMENGWSMKHVHRLIVNSATYRQSSKVTPEQLERDPYNRLLARGSRLRVEAEIIRDIQLAASGLLNPKLGGRSVKPPAPAFLFLPPASYAPFPWDVEKDDGRYRRAVYTFRRRTTPYPLLSIFDTPEGTVSCVRRVRSNTPLQALLTLNESMSMESAQALALRVLSEGGGTEAERIDYAFRRCLSRPPTASEREALAQLVANQCERITKDGIDPWTIATQSNPKPILPAGTTPVQLAAYTVLSRVLLNLDETITKE